MIEAGLSLSVLLFLLLVYLPGNLALLTAGRKKEEQTASASIFYGTWLLGVVLFFFLTLSFTGKSNIFERFISTLVAMASGKGEVDIRAVSLIFASCYGFASVAGLFELLMVTGAPLRFESVVLRRFLSFMGKVLNWVFSRKPVFKTLDFIRKTLSKCCSLKHPSGVKVNNSKLMRDIFVRFRKAGKRPQLEIVRDDGSCVKGECLRYCWNGKESVLLCDLDNPFRITWVVLDDAVSVKFTNLAGLVQLEELKAEETKVVQDIQASRRILNGLLPGYGDEVYGKYLQELSEQQKPI